MLDFQLYIVKEYSKGGTVTKGENGLECVTAGDLVTTSEHTKTVCEKGIDDCVRFLSSNLALPVLHLKVLDKIRGLYRVILGCLEDEAGIKVLVLERVFFG